MVREILFVQGGGEAAHDAWDDKLVASLRAELGAGYAIHYPRMPNEYAPRYAAWKGALLREISPMGEGTILVGHSIGATILVHALSEAAPRQAAAGLFLIAPPFIGDGGWPSDEIAAKPDLGARLDPSMAVFIYQGDADDTVSLEHAAHYGAVIPQAVIRPLAGRDHQLNNDLSEVAADIVGLGWRPESAPPI